MTKDEYIELFGSLGFYCRDKQRNRCEVETAYNAGRILKHPDTTLPTVYFNGKHYGVYVYFDVRLKEYRWFPARFWEVLEPQRPTDNDPNYMSVAPRSGLERRAFEELMDLSGALGQVLIGPG